MSTTGGPEHDELGRRLERALDDGLRAGPVDTTSLLAGAHAGARRLRRRRTVAAGVAAALVIAVPVGAVTLGGVGTRPAEVASEPDGSPSADVLSSPAPTRTSPPPAPDAPVVDASTLGPDDAAVDIPSSVGLTADDLPVPVEGSDSRARVLPVVNGQQCGDVEAGPIASYYQGFSETGSDALQTLAVYATVTAWSQGDGVTAFSEALDNTGACQFARDDARTPWTPSVGAEGFQMAGFLEANAAGTAVLRVGDLLVGVQASGAEGAYDYVALSSQLAETVGQRVVEAQVPGSSAP